MPKPSKPEEFKLLLDHARGQFQYHAGQRLNTFRYFFVAYAIFVAAYVGTMTGKTVVPVYVPLILGIMAFLVTLGFWALDARNAEMVHIDEAALKEIEGLVATEYERKQFEMTEAWDKPRYPLIQYKWIVKLLYSVIALVTLLAVAHDFLRIFCHA